MPQHQEQHLYIPGDTTKAVLLLHAFTGTPLDLQLLARAISRAGYTVYAPLFSGHGSDQIEDLLALSPMQWQQDARDAVEWLQQQGYTQIVAMGLSMGGVMATNLAIEQRVVAAGTFCAPVTTRNAQLSGLHESFMTYAHSLLQKKGFAGEQIEKELTTLAPRAHQILQQLNELTQTIASDVDRITGSFYIAQGEQDTLVDPEASIELKEKLVNAWVDFHWFEEAGHIITIGKERLAFQETVIQFLQQIEWR